MHGRNAGGGIFPQYYLPDTETQAYFFLFFFILFINQANVPLTKIVKK